MFGWGKGGKSERVVAIATDGSDNSKAAFNCK